MKVLKFLACAGLTVAAWPASAADLLGTAPPPAMSASQGPTTFEVGSNWYIRGDLGISFDDAPTISIPSVGALPGFGSGTHSTDFTGGVGFGYRFNDYLRFDGTWDYRPGPGGTQQGAATCPHELIGVSNPTSLLPAGYLYDTADSCIGTTDIRQYNNTFLANAYVDLGTYSGFTPYVGGGLGFNMNVLQGNVNYYETGAGQPYAADLTPDAPGNAAGYPEVWVNQAGLAITPQPFITFAPQNWSHSFSSTSYTLAWALSGGIGFQLNPNATLEIGYRYLNSGEVTRLVNPQTGMTIKQNNTSQQLRVGIRYVLQ